MLVLVGIAAGAALIAARVGLRTVGKTVSGPVGRVAAVAAVALAAWITWDDWASGLASDQWTVARFSGACVAAVGRVADLARAATDGTWDDQGGDTIARVGAVAAVAIIVVAVATRTTSKK